MKICKKPENTAIFQRNLYIDLIKHIIFCSSSNRYLKQAAKLEKKTNPKHKPKHKNHYEPKELDFPDHVFQ